MKINKITLENIRSHKKNEIELDKGITVFTGRTGSGKSSILMALEYGLFGTEGGVNNNTILRRGIEKGIVTIDFEENGKNYTIRRGLKRSKSNITTDISNMMMFCEKEEIPLLGRASDLNNKILEIINYPDDIKPKDLFEITSYTRQDEIRALVEMGGEKRQEHIDKILQLSKYKSTWENMKDVVSTFESELKEMKVRVESLDELEKDVLKIKSKTLENESTIKNNEVQVSSLDNEYSETNSQRLKIEEEIKTMLEKRRLLDKTRGNISVLKEDLTVYQKKIEALSLRKGELQEQQNEIGDVGEFEKLQDQNIKLITEIKHFEKELKSKKDEFEKIKELGVGNCPACKQEITSNHLDYLDEEFGKLFTDFSEKITIAKSEQEKIEPLIRKSKTLVEIKENLNRVNENITEKETQLNEKKNLLKKNESEEKEIEATITDISNKESELKEFTSKEKELFSKINSLNEIIKMKRNENITLNSELSEKEKLVIQLEKSKENINQFEKTISTIVRMREDIRNIREIIRKNFLEDFRKEFQKKFEEIRKYEEEYTVDVKSDYEPIAITSESEEVPIANLSGGEKTSVALAYRLALADLAAQISAINPSEILILDEPTTGFDQEDVKALPEALKNIQTIPQILIVTHEEELKNAADYKYQITKQGNETFVSKTD